MLLLAAGAALAWDRPWWVGLMLAAAAVLGVHGLVGPQLRSRLLPLVVLLTALSLAVLAVRLQGALA